jgi:ribose/xylose/arabinose/galactoside ABC-type transport system permease subunit
LLAGNSILLAAIFFLIREGGSFQAVLLRAGPDIAPVALAGFALTGIIFTGAIDLSVASAIALSGTFFGFLVTHQAPPLLAFAGCFLCGWCIIALNGAFIAFTGIPSIIATLAGLPFYRGLALIFADSAIPRFSGNISIDAESYHLPGKHYAGLLLLFAIFAALFLEGFSKTARRWLALGNSPDACRLMGLSPRRILSSSFWGGGLFFGLAALVYVTRVQSIEPARMALGFELQVIAAVILGGTNIFGGEGSYLGTLLGAIFLYLVSQVLIYAGASPYLQEAITGAIILLIIGVDCALHRQAKLMEELA